ncbi:MAG: methylmalonyl Co-A mutase-associated GTPase MeaB [Syntrophorhabdaceae bacterium]|nr:methylmalonyl Co-A mutase-associated GTPase MeaB [Syntrophorhabdaceae bacterium]
MEIVEKILNGNEASAAKLISLIEEGKDEGYKAISLLLPYTGGAHRIGITGAPGSGKSTLIDKLATNFSKRGKKIGIIAIDPTSTKTDGALLGDRLRMRDAENIEGIFIRSMAHRGYPGGIAKATIGTIYILEALGKDLLLIESVGIGQTEINISTVCDTLITVFTPDYGDEIQLMKAGMIELGDIIAINKSDMPGASNAQQDIKGHVNTNNNTTWDIPVILTQAQKGDGIEMLIEKAESHFKHLKENNLLEKLRSEKLKKLMLSFLKEEIWAHAMNKWAKKSEFLNIFEMVAKKEIDFYKAVSEASNLIFPDC